VPASVEELVWLADVGYDVVTGPRPIIAVETSAGTRFENLHKIGWPATCDCGTPSCAPEADAR
jgi:hypothetical protein